MRHLIGLLLILSGEALANTSQDVADIQRVMSDYHEAVVTHDGTRLATLFIPEGSTWVNVLTAAAYSSAKAKSTDTPKVRLGNYRDFARFVSNSKADLNPQHAHVQILTDGTIAAAYFNFVFFIDGHEENRGSEAWQLVKGNEGWRIVAITYSSAPHPQ